MFSIGHFQLLVEYFAEFYALNEAFFWIYLKTANVFKRIFDLLMLAFIVNVFLFIFLLKMYMVKLAPSHVTIGVIITFNKRI